MSTGTLALVLVAAAIHAAWNVWIKQIPIDRSAPLMWLLTTISAVCYAPLALGVGWRQHVVLGPTASLWMGVSALLHVGYFLLLLRGYRASDLSVVYPVARGTGPLLAAFGAVAWLGERMTAWSIAGLVLVTAGILVLTLRPGLTRASRLHAGLVYGALTGVTIAAYTLWDGKAVSRVGLHPLIYYWGGELIRCALFTPSAIADPSGVRALWSRHRGRIVAIALMSPLSYILILIAFRRGPVSHIAPVRELSILFGAWLGARVLGEGDRVRRLIAAAAFAAGVFALAIG
jgi:drug/metabolite transporter (DMT)-like permease